MLITIPIGNESTLKGLPWATIGVAVACFAVQLHSCAIESSVYEDAAQIQEQMLEPAAVIERFSAVAGDDGALRDDLREAVGAADMEDNLPFGLPSEREVEAAKVKLEDLRQQEEKVLKRLPAYQLGYRPGVSQGWTLLTHAFAHGGWLHLIGNLLFLYMIGCNIEDRWGRGRFLALYLGAAIASALAFRLWHPGDNASVLVGASGAIAGAMGAFLLCFTHTRLRFAWLYWSVFALRRGVFETPAWVALPAWFLQQVFWSTFEAHGIALGVAYSGHVGGFVFGAIAALALKLSGADARIVGARERERTKDDWSEDPRLLEAQKLATGGHRNRALTLLEELLTDHPTHAEGRLLALDLSSQIGSEAQLSRHAGEAFALLLRRGEREQLFARYTAIRKTRWQLELGEQALRHVISSARDDLDPVVPIDAASQLIRQHPDSPFIPRAMWVAAEAQARLSRIDLAERTLRNIVTAFPMDPFAEQARRKLKGPSLRPESAT